MRNVISKRRLREFWRRHPDAEAPLTDWHKTARKAEWRKLSDIQETYSAADGVRVKSGRNVVVFNIGGKKYRLIADVLYDAQVIYVCAVLTHADYSRGRWKDTL